ncbi:hypothetical protein K7432_000452 [Basidiobolus ranarum]|uniref:J domain-containing protein n=1 Tax=Basidiobolus ranarum TaxID=34480 RepID=A0ABR2X4P4_9FUNG
MNTSNKKELTETLRRIVESSTEYYQVLGVPRNSTSLEIKRAYKKLALVLHPDKNPSKEAEEAFKVVSKAYSVLGEEKARRTYDLYGVECTNQGTPKSTFSFVHFIPILIILLSIIFNIFFEESNVYPEFRYFPSAEFPLERFTEYHNIRYFAKPELEHWLQLQEGNEIQKFEQFIEFQHHQLKEIRSQRPLGDRLLNHQIRFKEIQSDRLKSNKLLTYK